MLSEELQQVLAKGTGVMSSLAWRIGGQVAAFAWLKADPPTATGTSHMLHVDDNHFKL